MREWLMTKSNATRMIAARLITTTAMMILIAGPAAIAQTGTGSSGGSNQVRPIPQAPIGHRQPKASDVPPEKNLGNPNDPANKEDAALDRKIKSICRGC
jgi:hypothetical protein